jgi:cysteine-rich repeat protein
LNEGTVACGTSTTNCCGNGDYDTGEECELGDEGCDMTSCLWAGSSTDYSTASFCGDGSVDIGEECDTSETLANGDYGVSQIATGAAIEVDEDTGYAITQIAVTVDTDVTGTANLALECACTTDNSCGATGIGCGNSNCCYERPELVRSLVQPEDNTSTESYTLGGGHCRNVAVAVAFSEWMDESTFDQTEDLNEPGDTGYGTIEEDEVNATLFLDLVSIEGVDVDASNCPSTYTGVSISYVDRPLLARAWHWVKSTVMSVFGREVAAHEDYLCYVPLAYEASETEDEEMHVYLRYTELLQANSEYRLMVLGDADGSDETKEGAISANGATLCLGTSCDRDEYEHNFYVGEEICTLDRVVVEDTGDVDAEEYDSLSIQYFSSTGEEHEFEVTPQTYRTSGGYEEISPITDVYDWEWAWDSSEDDDDPDEDVVAVESLADYDVTEISYTASGNSGDELVLATATITADVITEEGTEGSTTTGSVDIEALVCENPWPALDSDLGFPYVETDESTYFSFYYCRDAGADGTDDDLPAFTEDSPIDVTSIDASILQELIFQVDGTSDAIGVRVLSNEEYLSPSAWVEAQGFTGNFSETEIDGYQAVQSGTTIYAAVANVSGDVIYPNMYVISYNEDAGEDAADIFDLILDQFEFNANTDEVTDINLCWNPDSEAYITDEDGDYIDCDWDGACYDACSDGTCSETDMTLVQCDAEKGRLTRDMKRLTDVTDMIATLEDYGDNNGRCSVTTGQSCTEDDDCPGSESCEASYPLAVSGTFVPSMSVSTWGSWNASLSNDLGTTLSTDPINEFYNCSEDGFDSTSCWNGEAGEFMCPDRSHVYGYKTVGGNTYTLYTQMESSLISGWAYDIDMDGSDDVTVVAEWPSDYNPDRTGSISSLSSGFETSAAFCDGSTWGDSELCGDGTQGATEVCEIGDTSSDTSACSGGVLTLTCIDDAGTCRYQTTTEALADGAECIEYSCGNGVVEDGEDCDDGSLNGTYGYCDDNCEYTDSIYCGDGYLAGSEQCDCGTTSNFSDVSGDPSSWAAINGCDVANGLYSSDIDLSCAYNCTTPGLACGDGVTNGEEECDGDYEEWEGATCSDGTTCTSDSDCDSGSCGDGVEACGISRVCEEHDTAGQECTRDSDCEYTFIDTDGETEVERGACDTTEGMCEYVNDIGEECEDAGDCEGSCSTAEYETYHYRGCDDATCGWDSWSQCVGGEQVCGNGTIEGTEECDDGNDSNHDACTNQCQLNVCGDDYVNVGVESCDDGDENGEECDAAYGGTCNYCNSACQYKTRSGAFCGDGEVDTTYEVCDGGYATAFEWMVWTDGEFTGATDGECSESEISDLDWNGDDWIYCSWAGVCNGGDYNGQRCALDYEAWSSDGGTPGEDTDITSCEDGGGTCQAPICADDCGSSCPTSYETVGLEVQSETGTTKVDAIDLYSYQNNEGDSPDSGVIYVPACNVATRITADVDDSEMILPDVDIIFVTDFSSSMDAQPDGSSGSASSGNRRIDYVAEAAEEAIGELFDAFDGSGATVRIGLASYTTRYSAGYSHCSPLFASTVVSNDGGAIDSFDTFLDSSNESFLTSIMQSYPDCVFPDTGSGSSGATPTYLGLEAAIDMMNAQSSSSKVRIIVMLTDGNPTYNKLYSDGTSSSSSSNTDSCDDYDGTTRTYYDADSGASIGSYSDGTDRCVAEIYDDLISANDGIIYYTATVNDSTSLQGYMAHLTSNECDWDDINSSSDCEGGYAYTAETAEEILEMYDAITDSIIGTTLFENATDNSGNITVSSGSVVGGDDIELPFPEGFVCKATEQQIPIRHTMYGEGFLEFSDFNLTYCPYQ